MNNKKLIIAIILSIIGIISLIYGMTARPKTGILRPDKLSGRRMIGTGEQAKRRAAKTDFNFWVRNPFVYEESPVKAVEKLTLCGIMWDEKTPLAIINDSVVGIGDKVGENRVVGIEKDRVILNDGADDFELRLTQ